MSTLDLRSLASLVRDNPVLEKDAAMLLRARVAPFVVAAAGVLAWLLATIVHVSVEPTLDQLGGWRGLEPSGRAMFAALVGALLALETLLLPSIASSALAGERERGTLPLLQVSALTPGRIVAGKVLGLVVAAAPLFFAALPLLALASIYGGVSLFQVAGAAVLLAVHGFALISTGVGASSIAARARSAGPLAMLFSLVPTIFAGFPGVVVLASWVDGDGAPALRPIIAIGVLAELLVAAACLLLARSRLAPRSAPRWPLRRVVVAGVLVALPPLAGLAFHLGAAHPTDEVVGSHVAGIAEVIALALGVMLFEVCCASNVRGAERTPLASALTTAAFAAAGLALAWLVPDPSFELVESWRRAPTVHELPLVAVADLALYCAFASLFAAAVSRFVRWPAVRVVVVLVALGGLFVAPIALHEVHALFNWPAWPLEWTNPAAMIGRHDHFGARDAPWGKSLGFFAGASALLAVVSRVRDRHG